MIIWTYLKKKMLMYILAKFLSIEIGCILYFKLDDSFLGMKCIQPIRNNSIFDERRSSQQT